MPSRAVLGVIAHHSGRKPPHRSVLALLQTEPPELCVADRILGKVGSDRFLSVSDRSLHFGEGRLCKSDACRHAERGGEREN
jgi:hypothetical protein